MSTKIVMLSDTHGSPLGVQLSLEKVKEENPDFVIHLGDDYGDAQVYIDHGFSTLRVPGTWTEEYKDYRIENRRFEMIEGWRFFLTHTPTPHFNDLADDPNPEQVRASDTYDIFCHGHTHRPEVYDGSGRLILNPGHCKHDDRRGYPMSLAIINLKSSQASISILELETGSLIQHKPFVKAS